MKYLSYCSRVNTFLCCLKAASHKCLHEHLSYVGGIRSRVHTISLFPWSSLRVITRDQTSRSCHTVSDGNINNNNHKNYSINSNKNIRNIACPLRCPQRCPHRCPRRCCGMQCTSSEATIVHVYCMCVWMWHAKHWSVRNADLRTYM